MGVVRDGAAVALAIMGDKTQAVVFRGAALKDEDHRRAVGGAWSALTAMKDASVSQTPIQPLLNDQDSRTSARRRLRTLGDLKDA